MLREQIVQAYLSGRKTCAMLGREYGVCPKTINKMVSRYRQQNIANFAGTIFQPIMPRTKIKQDSSALQAEKSVSFNRLNLTRNSAHFYVIGF